MISYTIVKILGIVLVFQLTKFCIYAESWLWNNSFRIKFMRKSMSLQPLSLFIT